MRGDRLLSILLQLQAGGRLTARELADRLEVSERTIHRDVDALSGAGVPVYAERGRGGGIGLLDDYRTDLTGLTSDEARALFSFGGPQVAGQLGLGSDLEAALRKLLAALPAAQRLGAQRARERLLVDTSPWLRSADALPRLAQLQDAVWGDRRLRIRYRRGEGRGGRGRAPLPRAGRGSRRPAQPRPRGRGPGPKGAAGRAGRHGQRRAPPLRPLLK